MKDQYKQYIDLIDEIRKHDKLYYIDCKPIISDYEYDQLVKKLESIEKAHSDWILPTSPTQTVGGGKSRGFKQVKHHTPMLSLANTYSYEEIEEFIARMQKLMEKKSISFFSELKMDGASLTLRYEKGNLVLGATRGDGKSGDDITSNVRSIANIPLRLKGDNIPNVLEVRGEVHMPLSTFSYLNQEREDAGLDVWANPRNAAAGSLKLLDAKEVFRRRLDVVVYDIAEDSSNTIVHQADVAPYLASLGLPTFKKDQMSLCTSLNGLTSFIEKIEKIRNKLPFEIDGVVIKVDDIVGRQHLGYTGKSPRWAVAYKFAPEQAVTKIEEITIQVGRTGVLTPVAELIPVFVAGSTISRATLHNQDEIKRKDIRVHDTVVIEKGGDVIPKVVSVDLTKRPKDSRVWKMPAHCPSCNAKVVHIRGEVAVRCPNKEACPAQNARRIIFFAAKNAMDIDHLGEKVIEKLIEMGFVKSLPDIYRLTKDQLAKLEGFKEKSVNNLLDSIEASKKVSLSRLIIALGIKFVGVGNAELLAHHARDITSLAKIDREELENIDGIGPKAAEAVVEFFANTQNQKEVKELLELGVAPEPPKKITKDHPFSGKTFVLTGTLEHFTRAQAGNLIKERGGKVSASVSSKTDYVLYGSEAGSKLKKAESLGIDLLTESEFEKAIK